MITNKNIGIWGFGVVGKSAINYFLEQNFTIELIDKRELTIEEYLFLDKNNIKYSHEIDIDNFVERNNLIFPSPGIDLTKHNKYKDKFVAELDVFFKSWQKPIISVTGTLGKTTVVNLLSKILSKSGLKIATAGNIGIGMLDLIKLKNAYDYALLELSSFQLEYTKQFAPDLAIWTNFFDNHIDRHQSVENYFNAKFSIIKNQNLNQKALVNWKLKDKILCNPTINLQKRSFSYFYTENNQNLNLNDLRSQDTLYYLENNNIIKMDIHSKKIIYQVQNLPKISYLANWVIIIAALDILNLSLNQIDLTDLSLPPHRLQHIATIDSVQYYNDSKSTLAQSTLVAVNQFENHPIHLFLGGISKGVDRSSFIKELVNKVHTIYCFGSESQFLYSVCTKQNIKVYKFDNLNQAFAACVKNTQKDHIVLFSPSGASYDQFKNYEERGNYYISLVKNLENHG